MRDAKLAARSACCMRSRPGDGGEKRRHCASVYTAHRHDRQPSFRGGDPASIGDHTRRRPAAAQRSAPEMVTKHKADHGLKHLPRPLPLPLRSITAERGRPEQGHAA